MRIFSRRVLQIWLSARIAAARSKDAAGLAGGVLKLSRGDRCQKG
jgi:hypothetical protein